MGGACKAIESPAVISGVNYNANYEVVYTLS